ncbi:hypothetical protein [Archangium sp. Cb G35]|uniref:hypothetical protein n=1 Tax=Archangium sp. Cb G35 TaxID=1920190 RepID=UPI001160FB5D|nr:hypothetical protein [Archangium sp. Cb G35]
MRRTIEDAIRIAWQRLLTEKLPKRINLSTASEVEFTARLVQLLNDLRDLPDDNLRSFSSSMFQVVVRGGEVESFDGKHLEKRPDMVFRLIQPRPGIASSEYDGLFVECKIVDVKHPLSLYCKDGLRRFLDGEYAWAMKEALMVAYSRQGWTVPKYLVPYLKKHSSACAIVETLAPRAGERPAKPQVLVSSHARTWSYPGGGTPGKIEVAHLWLDAEIKPIKARAKKKA